MLQAGMRCGPGLGTPGFPSLTSSSGSLGQAPGRSSVSKEEGRGRCWGPDGDTYSGWGCHSSLQGTKHVLLGMHQGLWGGGTFAQLEV